MLKERTLFPILLVIIFGFFSIAMVNISTDISPLEESLSLKATLEGKVMDYETGEILIGVEVEVLEHKKISKSNEKGEFQFEDLEKDHVYYLKFKHDKYLDFEIPVITDASEEEWSISVRLKQGQD
tara:strand:- start:31584 stop:31961 length:378 start_codon:yes stop_codon:yes gene_type:complete